MSFFLKRGSSFTGLSNIRKRLPGPEEVFREGYVFRKTQVLVVTTWSRNFCILQHGTLAFHASWDLLRDDASPLVSCEITRDVVVSLVPKKPTYLTLECPTWTEPLHLYFDSEVECLSWKFIIDMEVSRQQGQDIYPPPIRSRFFEGLLFKTPPEADRWEERWFELSGEGELSYWQSHGVNKRGTIDLETAKVIPNKTDAKGICTPFIFQIHTFVAEEVNGQQGYRKRVFNLSAPTQVDYLNWLKALKIWIGVKRPKPLGLEKVGAALQIGSDDAAAMNEADLGI